MLSGASDLAVHYDRVTITLPPDRGKRIKRAVDAGQADSVPAYVAHVLEAYEQKQSFLSEEDRKWLQADPARRRPITVLRPAGFVTMADCWLGAAAQWLARRKAHDCAPFRKG